MVFSHSNLLVLAGGFLILEGYSNMSYNYGPRYKELVELMQQGGPAATKAARQATQSRGYMSPVNVSMVEDDDEDYATSLNTKVFNRFKEVRENSEFLNNTRKGNLIEDIDTPVFSKSSGVTVDKAYETSFKLIDDLKADYGMSTEVAAGFVGNLWHETGGFKYMQEIRPLVKGSKGGLGFAQWTGRRRDNFESYLKQEGKKDTASYDANYGFLKKELDTTEGRVLKKLEGISNIKDATKVVSETYLIPSKKYAKIDERIEAAEDILKRYNEDRSLTDEDN